MKLKQLAYHRNGVCAAGFHAIIFKDAHQTFLASVFNEPGAVSVICLDLLPEHGVTFGQNSWRGDRYEPQLRRWIEESEK